MTTGDKMTIDEVYQHLQKMRPYYKKSNRVEKRPAIRRDGEERKGTPQHASPNLLDQGFDQGPITSLAHYGTQPQAGASLQRHRQPQHHSLCLDPDFVGLHVLQITRLLHQLLMDLLTVPARFTVRSSHPKAATIARGGQPYVNSMTTMMISASGLRAC